MTRANREWLVFGLLALFEFALFHNLVIRDIAPYFPRAYDQTAYLTLAYQLTREMREIGTAHALLHFLRMPSANGVLFPTLGALAQLVLPPGREAALCVNFSVFVAFQALFFDFFRKKGPLLAWGGLGLLLAMKTTFFYAGDLFDFRMDFSALCLYGIFLITLLRSRSFSDRRWTLAAAGSGAALILVRYISAVYISALGLALAAVCGACLAAGRRDLAPLRTRDQAVNAGTFTAAILAVCLPFFWLGRQAIFDYYVVGHLKSPEQKYRAIEYAVNSHLFFYVRSIATDHLGGPLALLAGILLLAAVGAALRARARFGLRGGTEWLYDLVLVSIGVLCPLVILTANPTKSPIVGSITVAPLIILFLLLLTPALGPGEDGRCAPRWHRVVGGLCVFFGFGIFLKSASADRKLLEERKGAVATRQLYDRIQKLSFTHDVDRPVLAFNYYGEASWAESVFIYTYENNLPLLHPTRSLGQTIFEIPRPEVFAALQSCDFLVFNRDLPDNQPFPFMKEMRELKGEMATWARMHMVQEGEFPTSNGTTILYARPALASPATGGAGESASGGG